MLIVEWTPITETRDIPFMGTALEEHLNAYKKSVRCTSCSAWNLLYNVLNENNLPISMVSFTYTGKPFFIESNIYFSLSHSHALCAVAISDQPVGIDIELCKDSYNSNLIEKSLTDAEKVSFDGDFTRIWCRKEAVAKMTGDGIAGYPNNIETNEYEFFEQMIEYSGKKYCLVAVNQRYAPGIKLRMKHGFDA